MMGMDMMAMEEEAMGYDSAFGEFLDLSRKSSSEVGVLFGDSSIHHYHHHHRQRCTTTAPFLAHVTTTSKTNIKCSRDDLDLPNWPEHCGTQPHLRVLVRDPPRQNLTRGPVKNFTGEFQVHFAGKTSRELVRLPTEVRFGFNHLRFSASTTTNTFVASSPPSFRIVSPTVAISQHSNLPHRTHPNLDNSHTSTNNTNPARATHPYLLAQSWRPPHNTPNTQTMVKKRRSLQAIFVPSFLQGGALSLSPTLLSPTSPTLPPSPTPMTVSSPFKQRARAHSAAAVKAARALGEEAIDAYASLRSGMTATTTPVAVSPSDAPQFARPSSPPASSSSSATTITATTPSRRKASISSIIQAIPSFSAGITGISLDKDVEDMTPPTTPVQASPVSAAIKGPRASPPPSYLIDDDPFANLSGAPVEVIHSSAGASGSASDVVVHAIPPSPLNSGRHPPSTSAFASTSTFGTTITTTTIGESRSAYAKGKARSGSLSLPSSPPATSPGFANLPHPPHSHHQHHQQSHQHHPPRAFGGRGHPRPATQRPAFRSRPSLPSLNTLASMNVVLSRKPRKGKVGAGLPFEPWDNVDTPPDSALDSSVSPSPSSSSSGAPAAPPSSPAVPTLGYDPIPPVPPLPVYHPHDVFASSPASSIGTETSLNNPSPAPSYNPSQSHVTRPTLKPLLPSQILALGSVANDMEMAMMYEKPVVPERSVSLGGVLPTSATSISSLGSSSDLARTQPSRSPGPPQLPPLSLDFVTPSFGGEGYGCGGSGEGGEGEEEMKSPLEREFEAAVSPLSSEGDHGVVESAVGGMGYGYQVPMEERGDEDAVGERFEGKEVGDADERGRRQSVVAIGADADSGVVEEDVVLGLEGPALLAIRRQLEEEVEQIGMGEEKEGEREREWNGFEDAFSNAGTPGRDLTLTGQERPVSHVEEQTEVEMVPPSMPSPPESTSSYGYGYGYGYTSQNPTSFGSPVLQDNYQSPYTSSYAHVHPDSYAGAHPDVTPLFSPPQSDWSRSRSLSSTSMSSIDDALDLDDFSALKRLSDASEQRQGMGEEHPNFNVMSSSQYSPDVSITSPAISAQQFNFGLYDKDKDGEKDPQQQQQHSGHHHHHLYQHHLLGDEFHLSSNFANSVLSRTRSSSFTPSVASSSYQPLQLGSSDEGGDYVGDAGFSVGSQVEVPRPCVEEEELLGDDVDSGIIVNDGSHCKGGEGVEGGGLSAEVVDAGILGRAESGMQVGIDDLHEGMQDVWRNGIECEAGVMGMSGSAEGGSGQEVENEEERENGEVIIGGGRTGEGWLLGEGQAMGGLALLQPLGEGEHDVHEDEGEAGEASLKMERGLMFGIGMNASGGADAARDDNSGKNGHDMLDVHGDKLSHPLEGVLLSVSPPFLSNTTTSTPVDPSSFSNESHDINAAQPQTLTRADSQVELRSGEDNTQTIPILGLVTSESQDHNPQTAIDGAFGSNTSPFTADSLLNLPPLPSRSSTATCYSHQSQSPSERSAQLGPVSPRLGSQYLSASSSTSVSPRSSISLREGDFTSPEYSELEPMTRGASYEHLSDGVEGYSYGNGGQGAYSSSSRGGSSAGYHNASSSSGRTAYRGGYPGSGGGGAGGHGGDDREDEERRRRRKLAEMGYVSRSTSRRYKDATSGEEDDETRVYRSARHAPPIPALPQSLASSSSVQRYASTSTPTRFPVTSSSSRSASDYDSDSSDDDVPLAQRIPGALKAQKTIRRQVKEEREQRKQQRREGGRESDAQEDYRLRQDTLRPAAASAGGGYAMAGAGFSSSQEAALLAVSSIAANSDRPAHLREHPGRRQRTMTLPSKPADSTAPSAFNADDLVRKLQHVQMSERSSPISANLHQAMQSRSKSISRTSGDMGDSNVLSTSPGGGLASRSRSIRHPQPASVSPLPLSPTAGTTALPTLRPMRSFRRPSTAESSRPIVASHGDYPSPSNRTSTEPGPIPRRSLSQSRGNAERTYVRDDVIPPMPALPIGNNADEQGYALQQQPARKLIKPQQPGSLSRRPSIDTEGRAIQQALSLNMASLPPPNAAQQPASALSSARSPAGGALMRFFVFNLQQFNMVHVGPGTTAGDVVDMLQSEGALTGWAGVGGWMVWEIAQDFGMERPVRSFEIISEVQASWLKEKTVNYFLVRMTPLAVPLSRHAIPSSSPTHSGYVEWESKRGKWSKRWMMLKEHSLWISKRDNGRDEVLICSLSNFDAYQITRNHRAPKPFAFAVKSTDNLSFFEDASDYMHSFSCQEKDGVIWLEKILVARSYVLHQERNVLFNPKSANGNGAAVSRSATRARKMSTAGHRSPASPNAPLVPMPPLSAVLSHNATARNDVFEPGSLLAKQI
ncbi:hypothetical protein CVT24_000905 [Panaeolus cyanescens]|uniref:PH domain-containing protein n=1 Tax=Panaeolus cyanescens TaxID=181874 RepID=A0A409YY12_9AGAR|nr:hypothetical protein CVT24_000905 [Panaeolus cyanescens]